MKKSIYLIIRKEYDDEELVNSRIMNGYFEDKSEAARHLHEEADDEFEDADFYKCVSDPGTEIERPYNEWYEGLHYILDGKKQVIDYELLCVRPYNKKTES